MRDQSLALTFDEDTARWSVSHPRPRPLSLERRAILDVLKEAGRPLSPKEIALALDKRSNYVYKTMHYMALKIREKRGRYRPYTPGGK